MPATVRARHYPQEKKLATWIGPLAQMQLLYKSLLQIWLSRTNVRLVWITLRFTVLLIFVGIGAGCQNRIKAEREQAAQKQARKQTAEKQAAQIETYNKYVDYISNLSQSYVQINPITSKIGPFETAPANVSGYSAAVREVENHLKVEDRLEVAQKEALLKMLQTQLLQNGPEQLANRINNQTERKLYLCARVWGVNVKEDNGFIQAVIALKGLDALSRLMDADRLTIQDVAREVFPNAP